MLQEILDDAIVIECEYPSINQGDTGKRWFRIKTALVEAQKTPTNTDSQKLLLSEALSMCEEHYKTEDRCPICGSYKQA